MRKLNIIAGERGQALAQMALCRNLRFQPVASVLIGASRPEQITENVAALKPCDWNDEELERIQRHSECRLISTQKMPRVFDTGHS